MAPILTLAIPTYNRADILDGTLEKLFADPAMDERVEVVVSDNCSTDHTSQVVAKYPKVKYFKNTSNVTDRNFTLALERSSGEYIKLHNDTLRLKNGKLEKMLRTIEQEKEEKRNLLFFQNYFLLQNSRIEFTTQNGLLKYGTFNITWIANTGLWREDFERITDKNRFIDSQFPQVDWLLRNTENGKPTLLIADDFFEVIPQKKKGGYNVFNTFINKYLNLLKQFDISRLRYKVEKYRLFRYFVIPSYLTFQRHREGYDFELTGQYKIIFKNYWYEPYYSLFLAAIVYTKLKRS